MSITLKRISSDECEKLWKMQVEAFTELLEKYHDYDISPANEPMSRVMERLEQSITYYYFIMAGGSAVGAIRVVAMKDGSPKRVSPIFIMKEHRGKGYGTAFLSYICKRLLSEGYKAMEWSALGVNNTEGCRVTCGAIGSLSCACL